MITMRVTKAFFDKAPVIRAADQAKRSVLSRAGAFIRTAARSLIRNRKKVSAPGQPPSSHTGILKRFLYFAWDASAESVVVGPAKTNQIFFDKNRRPVRGTVPSVLEFGGQITMLEVFKYGQWQRADLRSRRRLAGLPMRYRTATIKARPFMKVAFDRERPKVPQLWAGSVKGG